MRLSYRFKVDFLFQNRETSKYYFVNKHTRPIFLKNLGFYLELDVFLFFFNLILQLRLWRTCYYCNITLLSLFHRRLQYRFACYGKFIFPPLSSLMAPVKSCILLLHTTIASCSKIQPIFLKRGIMCLSEGWWTMI